MNSIQASSGMGWYMSPFPKRKQVTAEKRTDQKVNKSPKVEK